MPGFRLIHRLLVQELALLFLLCLMAFLTIMLLGKMLQLHDVLLALNLSALDLAQLFFYLSPFFVMFMFPVACMLSMFLAFQRMSADRELLALRAGGVSLAQIFPAPLFFMLLCLAMNLFISFYGVSWGMHNFQATLLELAQTQSRLALQPGAFNKDIPGLTIYARNVDQEQGILEQVFVRDSTDERAELDIVAPRGKILTDHDRGKIIFALSEGNIYRTGESAGDILGFEHYSIALDLDKLLGQLDLSVDDPKYMGWSELHSMRAEPDLETETRLSLDVEIQKRLALPMACLVLGLMALPLGWICEGIRRQFGAGIILGVFFLYYALFSLGMGLGETGNMSVKIAVWLPNVLFILLAAGLFYFAQKERSLNVQGLIKSITRQWK